VLNSNVIFVIVKKFRLARNFITQSNRRKVENTSLGQPQENVFRLVN